MESTPACVKKNNLAVLCKNFRKRESEPYSCPSNSFRKRLKNSSMKA
ncbi:hypothetical protein SCFA_680002 [anaerobic digester metagenome]|uniref:Uncharacterized protein n=1 Tax=anaerobic digester metagenome TaxID=1263854 RepID=A0A485M546_9ZZZZ